MMRRQWRSLYLVERSAASKQARHPWVKADLRRPGVLPVAAFLFCTWRDLGTLRGFLRWGLDTTLFALAQSDVDWTALPR